MGAYIRLRRAQLKLYQPYASLLDPCRASTALDHLLVQDYTVDHLTILNRTAHLLNYADIAQVNILCGLGIDHLQH